MLCILPIQLHGTYAHLIILPCIALTVNLLQNNFIFYLFYSIAFAYLYFMEANKGPQPTIVIRDNKSHAVTPTKVRGQAKGNRTVSNRQRCERVNDMFDKVIQADKRENRREAQASARRAKRNK